MSSSSEFRPDWASAPGDTIADILRERGLSDADFARQLGQTFEQTRDLLEGRAALTIAIARRLEGLLGASVSFWMSRDFHYRQDIARLQSDHEWLRELPVGDMVRFGWLSSVPHPSEEIATCLRFFGVPSVSAWRETYAGVQQMFAFRTSPTLDSRPGAVAAWLRRGEIEADDIPCQPWNAESFRASLSQLRALTKQKDPRRFLPVLRQRCSEHGVAVAVVRAPSGCRASGATRFLSKKKALLLLSARFLRDDQFWFTFFHEAGHLLLHGFDGFFIEGQDATSSEEEQEANNFAANILVPPEYQAAMLDLRANTDDIVRFAVRLGISPGIVVGQLQHHGRLRQNQMNSLKRFYEWDD